MSLPWQELNETLKAIGRREGTRMFMGYKPDRWFDAHLFRCTNDHVSSMILKSEERGDSCLACQAPVVMTFPEDRDGPLVDPTQYQTEIA